MLKYITTLLAFLMFGSAFAADNISPRLDSLMVMAFERSLVPDTGNALVDTSFGKRAVNIAIGQVCGDFNAIEKFDTIVTVNTTRWYALNSDFSHLNGADKYVKDAGNTNITFPLEYPPYEDWYKLKPKGKDFGVDPAPIGKQEEPRFARTFGNFVQFYPQPVSADTMIITYFANDTSLTTNASQTSILPKFREAILLYAAALICERKGDFARADRFMQRYDKKLVDSKMKEPTEKQ